MFTTDTLRLDNRKNRFGYLDLPTLITVGESYISISEIGAVVKVVDSHLCR